MEKLTLQVVVADGRVETHEVNGDEVVIGRSSKVGLPIADRSMSRTHARVYRSGERWYVEDMGSRNGTFVNERRLVGPTPISSGDAVTLGASTVRVVGPGAVPTETGPSTGHTFFRPASEILNESRPDFSPEVESDATALRKYAERLHMLNEVHHALARSVEQGDLLELILDRVFDHLRPEQGAVFLAAPDGMPMRAATRSSGKAGTAGLDSQSLWGEVVGRGQTALVLDAETDERFNQAASLMSAGIRSVLAAPLLAPEGSLGMIVLASRLTSREFNQEDMELLTSLASVAALQIRNLRLAGEAAERRRLEQEVTLAREIQVALLPEKLPVLEGWELHAGNLPSRGVSGDFYKVHERSDGSECVMLLADVSGKGIAASLLTASLEALTANLIEAGGAPDTVCATASRLLFERTPPEKFATLFLGIVNMESGIFSYCNAGHNPALVVSADGSTKWLESTGMPVGMLPMGTWTAGEVELGPGDLVLLYTDGITEAENPDEEEYGNQRLEAVVRRWREDPLPELLRAIDRDLNEFASGVPFADDRTMVVIRRSSGSGEA